MPRKNVKCYNARDKFRKWKNYYYLASVYADPCTFVMIMMLVQIHYIWLDGFKVASFTCDSWSQQEKPREIPSAQASSDFPDIH